MSKYRILSYGGHRGGLFEMQTISSIGIRSGKKYVDQITINNVSHGGNGGDNKGHIKLEEGEYINQVTIRHGDYIDYLKIETNKGQTLEGGQHDRGQGSDFSGEVIAISGRSGDYVDKLDFLITS